MLRLDTASFLHGALEMRHLADPDHDDVEVEPGGVPSDALGLREQSTAERLVADDP